ncbi:Hypothetical protein NTJ_02170 [Nesidiocoris tenuis]|uniref:Uncharacterized protein n=1 Tax=Nesidiocoris tenuis TaxID=355587 RepID=A0ABN7ABH3_9HEMI|nr:Hypothetical protein NTJ_02170 [Nesidiocoris tenuis]
MFKKKPELPPRPPLPPMNQIIEDLENAPSDDPVFAGAPELRDDSKDSTFAIAQEFMDMTHRLKELETLLIRQKAELEDNYKELKEMGENIKKQSLHALQQQVYCRPD